MYPEFPENKDINELEEFDNKSYVYEEDSYTSSQPKFSWLRLLAIILGLALIASLLIPVLGPLMDGFQSNEVSNPEDKKAENIKVSKEQCENFKRIIS